MKSVSGKKVEKLWQKSVDVKNINRFSHMAKLGNYLLQTNEAEAGIAVAFEALENRFTIPTESLHEMTYNLAVALAERERHDEVVQVITSVLWQSETLGEYAWKPLLLWQRAESQELESPTLASLDYEASADTFGGQGHFGRACDLFMSAALAAEEAGEFERAKSLAIKAIEIRREKKLAKKLPSDYLKMSGILESAGHLKMAKQYLEGALTLAEHLEQWDLAQRVRVELAGLHMQLGDVSTALYVYETASHEMETAAQTHYAIIAIKECRKIYISHDRDFEAYQMDQLLSSVE
jgi:tetratricopeptide (TPR) repeat protein